jgi:hypothetical protein
MIPKSFLAVNGHSVENSVCVYVFVCMREREREEIHTVHIIHFTGSHTSCLIHFLIHKVFIFPGVEVYLFR